MKLPALPPGSASSLPSLPSLPLQLSSINAAQKMREITAPLTDRERSFVYAYFDCGCDKVTALISIEPSFAGRDLRNLAIQEADFILSKPHVHQAVNDALVWAISNRDHMLVGMTMKLFQWVTDESLSVKDRLGAVDRLKEMLGVHTVQEVLHRVKVAEGDGEGEDGEGGGSASTPKSLMEVLRLNLVRQLEGDGSGKGGHGAGREVRKEAKIVDVAGGGDGSSE